MSNSPSNILSRLRSKGHITQEEYDKLKNAITIARDENESTTYIGDRGATEILGKIKAIVDDYIISNENGWLCDGDDNKTGFKAYFFEKILDVFANIPWERKSKTNKNDIESALDILWSRCQHCEETEKAIMLLRVYEKKLRGGEE